MEETLCTNAPAPGTWLYRDIGPLDSSSCNPSAAGRLLHVHAAAGLPVLLVGHSMYIGQLPAAGLPVLLVGGSTHIPQTVG